MDYITEKDRIYSKDENGKIIAEIKIPEESDGIITIESTFVDDSLRGQGVAGRLVKMALNEAKTNGKKIHLICPYAKKWFENHPEESEILV